MTEQYWDRNIGEWGKFYLGISHSGEDLIGPEWFTACYKASIGRIEARLMQERYRLTMEFINRRIHPGTRVVDIGCGTGIFTLAMLKRGATVVALDSSNHALELTKRLVGEKAPDLLDNLELIKSDIGRDPMTTCDAFLAVGVTPYLHSIETFFANTLPQSRFGFVSILDSSHWANLLRKQVGLLNVRKLNAFSPNLVEHSWRNYDFELEKSTSLGTGHLQEASKRTQS